MTSQLTLYPCQYPKCRTDIETDFNHPRKYCRVHTYQVKKETNRKRERLRRELKIGRICVRCNGKISKPYKSRYCTNYCYWLNLMKNRHYQRVIRSLNVV